jgi:thiosulfate dehydrogenase
MASIRSNWLPVLLFIVIAVVIASEMMPHTRYVASGFSERIFPGESRAYPDTNNIPADNEGDLIRYGKELVTHTSLYFGPQGIIAPITNGMNCQNCHLDAGLRELSNPFVAVASTYPKFRPRSGRNESVEFRINECMERSLAGSKIDSSSYEMRAMVAYIKWTGSNFSKDHPATGTGSPEPPYLQRAADPAKGRMVYSTHCARCHQPDGSGVLAGDSTAFIYPPLWGENSFAANAGLYRLSRLAGFIKHNMPFDSAKLGYHLPDEAVWDVGAYIVSQSRPVRDMSHDWPDISKKPVDHPFGPYADSFPQRQHQFGPFSPIVSYYKKNNRP